MSSVGFYLKLGTPSVTRSLEFMSDTAVLDTVATGEAPAGDNPAATGEADPADTSEAPAETGEAPAATSDEAETAAELGDTNPGDETGDQDADGV